MVEDKGVLPVVTVVEIFGLLVVEVDHVVSVVG